MNSVREYDPVWKRLVYYSSGANADFWDDYWRPHLVERRAPEPDPIFCPLVPRYVPKGGLILEAGCGTGGIVRMLEAMGYHAVGVDFAAGTLRQVQLTYPDVELVTSDVRALPFKDESFDAYISGGVIEHFREGYEGVISEMSRVLKRGGIAFVTFPFMSLLRRVKAALGCYEMAGVAPESLVFYQYALDVGHVRHVMECRGFEVLEQAVMDGIKGFKDEVPVGRAWLQGVYDGRIRTRGRKHLDRFLRRFAAHVALLVLRKA